jgi:hypothetical protein
MSSDAAPLSRAVESREDMLLALENLYLRAQDEREPDLREPRAQLGGAGLLRIALERYLLRVGLFLLERLPSTPALRKQWRDAEQFAASKLCRRIVQDLARPETATLPEVAPTLDAAREGQLFHRVNDELSALLHGRRPPPPAAHILQETAQFCEALLRAIGPRPWKLDRAARCADWSVLRPLSRTHTHELYLALDPRGQRRTLLVSRTTSAMESTPDTSLFAPTEPLRATSRAGTHHGAAWILAPTELGPTLADVVEDTRGGDSGLYRALDVGSKLVRLGRISSRPEAVLFARDDLRFEAPFVLDPVPTSSRDATRAMSALVAFGATASTRGDAHARWLETRAPRAVRSWMLPALIGGAPFEGSDAMLHALDAARRAMPAPDALSVLGAARPVRLPRPLLPALGITVSVVGALSITLVRRDEREPPSPRPPTPAATPTAPSEPLDWQPPADPRAAADTGYRPLAQLADVHRAARRWRDFVHGAVTPVDRVYQLAVRLRTVRERAPSTRTQVDDWWRSWPGRTESISIALDRAHVRERPADDTDAAECQTGESVFEMRVPVRELKPNLSPSDQGRMPCLDLIGIYTVRFVRRPEGLLVCQENWRAEDMQRACPGAARR